MKHLYFLVFLVFMAGCSSKATEKTGNLKEYYYPLEKMMFPVVYKYRVQQNINGIDETWEEYMLIQKDENDLYEFHTYSDQFDKISDFKIGYGSEALILIERHQNLGDTKLSPEKFTKRLSISWEQSSEKPVKYSSQIDFADSSGYYTLHTKGKMTFDGFVQKSFSFTKENRCSKINGRTELIYTTRSGEIVAQLTMEGYNLDLKGVGTVYSLIEGQNYHYSSTLTKIIKGEDALQIQKRMQDD